MEYWNLAAFCLAATMLSKNPTIAVKLRYVSDKNKTQKTEVHSGGCSQLYETPIRFAQWEL
jgi:hypothetical protein